MINVLNIFWDGEFKETKLFRSVEGAMKFSAEYLYDAIVDDDLFEMGLVDNKFPEDKEGFVNKCLELFDEPAQLNRLIFDDLEFDREEVEVKDWSRVLARVSWMLYLGYKI